MTKKVEFEMFSKLVHLLGCDIQPFEQSSLKRAEEDKQEVNEDDLSERSEEAYGGTKELVPLTCSLHLKLCKESSASVSEFGQEEDMDVSISTDNLKRCALASVSECVHLLLNYNVFQVNPELHQLTMYYTCTYSSNATFISVCSSPRTKSLEASNCCTCRASQSTCCSSVISSELATIIQLKPSQYECAVSEYVSVVSCELLFGSNPLSYECAVSEYVIVISCELVILLLGSNPLRMSVQ